MSNRQEKGYRVLLAGGGTGGHIFAALAIKQAIARKSPDSKFIFAGTRHGLEAVVIPRENEHLRKLWISGLHRRSALKNLLLPLKLIVSSLQSIWLLMTFKPHVVIGTGGYVMGPVLYFAQRFGFRTLLQEQNSFPGLTTRKLAVKANAICLGFATAKDRLPNAVTYTTGNPLRSSFGKSDLEKAKKRWALDPSRKTVLVFGGSLGAQSINEAIAGALKDLTTEVNMIWQTGKSGVPQFANAKLIATASQEHHLIVLPFIENMSEAYAAADLAICRAGAMTIAELAITGLPAVFIPYPHATDDHQTANAMSLVEQGAALIIPDHELTPPVITLKILETLNSANLLHQMTEAMTSFARPQAADNIADIALSLSAKS